MWNVTLGWNGLSWPNRKKTSCKTSVNSLTLSFSMFPFDPPENIRKPKVFMMFSGGSKRNIGKKRVKGTLENMFLKIFFIFNPFHATDFFLYPLKTSENLRFSDIFRGYRERPVTWNGLKAFVELIFFLRESVFTELFSQFYKICFLNFKSNFITFLNDCFRCFAPWYSSLSIYCLENTDQQIFRL